MSLQIPVQKDIGEYQEKIVGKMSLRTLACVCGGMASAIGVACIVHFVFHMEVGNATLPVMAASLPFWLAGFWRPFGMKLEEFLPLFIDHRFGVQRMVYAPCASLIDLAETGAKPGKPNRKARRASRRKGAELREPSKDQEQEQAR